MREYQYDLYECHAARCENENEGCEFESFVTEIAGEVAIPVSFVEQVLLWELELRDRQYLCPGNYMDWMAEDISAETGIDKALVYVILKTESDFADEEY